MAVRFSLPRHAGVVVALSALSLLAVSTLPDARAQDAAPPTQPTAASPAGQRSGAAGGRGNAAAAATSAAAPAASAEQHRLPPDSTTKQTLTLPGGRSLAFTATAGSIRLNDDKGEPQADIAYTSYQLDGAEAKSRPVTFVFNGGPGASSAYLQLGNAGPWRLPLGGDAATSSAPPELQPNAETWLDFTDLVFIDPVGTGYSRFVASGEDVRKRLLFGRGRRRLDRGDDPPLAGEVGPAAVAEIHHRRKLWRHPRTAGGARIANRARRRRQGADPDLAAVRFARKVRLQPPAVCREPALDGRGGAGGERPGHPRRPGRCRGLCPRRFSGRSGQGPGRRRGHHASGRPVCGADRDRSGGQPQAGRPLRHRRIPSRIRSPRRPGDRALRCVGHRASIPTRIQASIISAIRPAIP